MEGGAGEGFHIEGVDGENKQTSGRETRTESREIIGREIVRGNAMSQSLHFIPRV